MSFDEGRLNELQGALAGKMAEQKQIADSMTIEGTTLIADAEKKAAFQQNMADIKEIKGLIEGLGELGEVQRWVSDGASSVAAEADVKADRGPVGYGSLGAAFLDSPEFKELQGGRNGANMRSPFVVKSLHTKDVYGDMTGAGGQYESPQFDFGDRQRDGIVQMPMRSRRVRDLFPARTTTAAVIEYFRQTGYTITQPGFADAASATHYGPRASITDTGSGSGTRQQQAETARMVAQYANSSFGLKPQSKLSFVSEQAPIRTIAHWEAAHRNVLADEPQLRGIIDNELLYGLRLSEDQQILSGTGTNEQLEGILQCPGIQSYLHPQYSPGFIASDVDQGNDGDASVAAAVGSWNTEANASTAGRAYDTKADAIRRAITLAYLANYEPTGIIVNPADWEDIELTKNSQGTYLLAMSVAAGAEQRVWRVPVIDTPAIAQGTALVGAFGTGAQLYDREAASIRVSENHADFFVRNAVVVLAEERLALAVKRPESFVAITFDSNYSI